MPLSSLLLCATALVTARDPLDVLYTCIIPRAASISLFAAALLLTRALVAKIAMAMAESQSSSAARNLQRFGRKSLLVTGGSFLFAASCVYRSLNIADEGAFLCRGKSTVYNMPAAGRAVATVGELALVVQIARELHVFA